jgi:hypothetical protein
MNIKLLLLAACFLNFIACGNQQTENVTVNQNRNQNAVNNLQNDSAYRSNPGVGAGAMEIPKEEKTSSNAENAQSDFTGTSGVTDKKHDTKNTAVLRDVRAAAHDGYDRVVFEFEGAEMPSYHIEYIDKPVRACGSGDVVPLKGDGWLEIRFTPAAAHTEDGEPTVKQRSMTPNLKIIKEMKATCDFEAEVEWVLGVASPNRYRVMELKNPTRLAVDIKH